MQKSKRLIRLVALFVVFISLSAFIGDYGDEKDLIKAADKHFEVGDYAECKDLYAQLRGLHPQDPNYSYRYGVCLLFASEDKVEALRYLKFATKNEGNVDPQVFFYYGKALQANYEFDEAAKQYKKFQTLVKSKEAQALNVSNHIKQCFAAKEKIYDFKKMDVISKKTVGKQEFFRSYNLGSMKRNILITPDEFLTTADKKSGEYSLIVHHPMNEVIYFASYNKEGSLGGKDIFKIQKMPDGTFSDPVNLGPTVNTKMDEDYPYLHPNGRLLYFASKGRNGLGGFDIYKSELDTNTNIWGTAENVGFSINSPGDDILYVSDMDENIAYFASDRSNKGGNITVYKILPNKSDIPIVIVRGQIEIEGSRNHQAKISVYNSDGEELAAYSSQRSGTFVMTLDENQTYTVGVSAPGRGESKSKLEIPIKSTSAMISKKFVLSAGKLYLQEADDLLATSEAKNKLLKQSAKLDVNQTKDVGFNTKIERPQSSSQTSESADKGITSVNGVVPQEDEKSTTEDAILADAKLELEEVTLSKEKVMKQIDATYLIANKKKVKIELLKDEIEELSKSLDIVTTQEEKEGIEDRLYKKRTELKASVSSSTAAIELAKIKERELEVKKRQEKLAETYVEAVEASNSSGNSRSAIAKLEKTRIELDNIQSEIKRVQDNDGSAEMFAKADAAKKKVADLTLKQQTLEKDVVDIEQLKLDLKAQSKATRNKGQKEEFDLQIKELDEELADVKAESSFNQSKLDEAKSEYEVYSSTQNIFDEVYAEADDPDLIPVSDAQKNTIEKGVEVQTKSAEYTLKETALKTNTPLVKETEVISVNDARSLNAELDKKSTVSPEGQYSDAVAKAKLEKKTLEIIREEIDLLETALNDDMEKLQANEIEAKIAELRVDEKKSIEYLRKYVDDANAQEKQLPSTVLASKSNEVDLLNTLTDDISLLEKEINVEKTEKKLKTELITFDLENASDAEIDEFLGKNAPIRNTDFNYIAENKDLEQLLNKIKMLEQQAAKDLIEANKQQVKFEEKGGEGESPKAKKLKAEALKKQFDIAQVQESANKKYYISISNEIDMIIEEEMDIVELNGKSKKLNDIWLLATAKRDQANNEKNEKVKVSLINEANDLEKEAIVLQKEYKKAINIKKAEFLAAVEKKNQEDNDASELLAQEKEEVVDADASELLAQEKEEVVDADASELLAQEKEEVVDVDASELLAEEEEEVVDVDASKLLAEEEEEVVDVDASKLLAEEEEEVVDAGASKLLTQYEDNSKIEQTKSENNLKESQNINVAENSSEEKTLVVNYTEFNKENPTNADKDYANKKGYGIVRDNFFAYSNSEAVRKAKDEAIAQEKLAIEYFYEAEAKREEAKQNPDAAKNLEKEAVKLLNKGKKAQDKSSDKYGELNSNELAFNKEEIGFMLEYNEIVKTDSAEVLMIKADKLFEDALAMRKVASKEKSLEKKTDLINEAYKTELQGLELQNYIISGELDGDVSDIEEEVVVVVNKKEVNQYTKKADSLRTQANLETNASKKRALFEEARENELAGNTKRTKRLLDGLRADKVIYENNINIVEEARKQSNNNSAASKAWRFEQAADSLFTLADELKDKADKNTNEVERLVQISASNDFMIAAKEKQASSIIKYQESKSVPDESDFVSDFEKGELTDSVNVKVDASKAINSRNNEAVIKEPLIVENQVDVENSNATQASQSDDSENNITLAEDSEIEQTEDTPFDEVSSVEAEQEYPVDAQSEESKEETILVSAAETLQTVNEIKAETSNESSEEVYKNLIAEADESDAKEAKRVDEIVALKRLAEVNRNKSETLLSEIDDMTDVAAIEEKMIESNKFRSLAEQYEVDAKDQEIILKNNLSESKSKRKEAELILESIEDFKREDLIAEAESDNTDLEKVRQYVENTEAIKPIIEKVNNENKVSNEVEIGKDELITAQDGLLIPEDVGEKVDSQGDGPLVPINMNEEFGTNAVTQYVEIDMDNIALLDNGGTENSIDEEFMINAEKIYFEATKIPVDPAMPNGIIYQVQVGAFREKIDPRIFNGLSPLVGEDGGNGITRYKVGFFRGFKSANMAKGRIRTLGYPDAFVVVFYNGKRITTEQAEEVIEAADESEQFVYKNLVLDEIKNLKNLGIQEGEAFEASQLIVKAEKTSGNQVVDGESIQDLPTPLLPKKEDGLENDLLKIGGLFYTIQVGVFSSPKTSNDLNGVSPLYTERTSSGYLRYTTGVYRDFVSADERKADVKNQGVKDAFITAYQNNQRISAVKAREAQGTDNNASANSGSNKQADSSSYNAKVVFKVQVGAYRAAITLESTPVLKDLTSYDISTLKTSGGVLIYMVGNYSSKAEADNLRQIVVNLGMTDCYVVALVNEKRIPIQQALEMVK